MTLDEIKIASEYYKNYMQFFEDREDYLEWVRSYWRANKDFREGKNLDLLRQEGLI